MPWVLLPAASSFSSPDCRGVQSVLRPMRAHPLIVPYWADSARVGGRGGREPRTGHNRPGRGSSTNVVFAPETLPDWEGAHESDHRPHGARKLPQLRASDAFGVRDGHLDDAVTAFCREEERVDGERVAL